MTPTLADEVLSILRHQPHGVGIRAVAAQLVADYPSARLAFLRIEENGDAKLCRRGRGHGTFWLLPLDHPAHICVICKREFERSRGSKRVTCSRSCHAALTWQAPGSKEKRGASISAAHRTPEALERVAEHNRRRWAKPGERAKMSEQNRRQWRDPVLNAKRANGIQKVNGSPEKRAAQRDRIKKRWDSPEGRKKLVDGIRKSKGTPEARAKFGQLLRERWQNPETRPKLLAASKANRAKANAATRGKKQPPEHVAKRMAGRRSVAEARA